MDELYSGEDEEAELIFPSYDDDGSAEDEPGYSSVLEPSSGLELISAKTIIPSASDSSLATPYSFTSDRRVTAGDDIAVRPEPTKHVDYLSHKWREEDVWSSWRHIVAKRKFYNNSPRLENASWRSWTKSKYQLRTILPEQLNW